jgi:hypothetical protein
MIRLSIWLGLAVVLTAGCQYRKDRINEAAALPKTGKLVVVGFIPAMSAGEEPGVIRSPLSGAVFMAEPVPHSIASQLTANLFSRLLEFNRYNLVPPGQARGVFSNLISSDQVLGDTEIVRRIGEAFSADAVFMGYVYRWRERDGTNFAVRRPASVAFDLYLLRPDDGAILWRAKFDKTQQSLSENILAFDTFVRGGGRWMTADRLAEVGMEEALKKAKPREVRREQE